MIEIVQTRFLTDPTSMMLPPPLLFSRIYVKLFYDSQLRVFWETTGAESERSVKRWQHRQNINDRKMYGEDK